jgi:hypothetical protein
MALNDRRGHARRPLLRRFDFWQSGALVASGRSVNLSPAGACTIIHSPSGLEVRAPVTATISIPRCRTEHVHFEQVEVAAEVRWIEDVEESLLVALEFEREVDLT